MRVAVLVTLYRLHAKLTLEAEDVRASTVAHNVSRLPTTRSVWHRLIFSKQHSDSHAPLYTVGQRSIDPHVECKGHSARDLPASSSLSSFFLRLQQTDDQGLKSVCRYWLSAAVRVWRPAVNPACALRTGRRGRFSVTRCLRRHLLVPLPHPGLATSCTKRQDVRIARVDGA